MSDKLLRRAIALGAAGFRVHPLHRRNGEVCRINGWPDKASGERTQIESLWEGRDVVAIAVATGSDFTVVDIDVPGEKHKHDGHASLATARVDLPETLTIRTASGGTHYVYRTAGAPRRNVANVEHPERGPLMGVDVRGAGGFFKVHNTAALLEGVDKIADAPPWLPLATSAVGSGRRANSRDLEAWLAAEITTKPASHTREVVEAVPLQGVSNSDLPSVLRPILMATLDRRGRVWAYENARERYLRHHGETYGKAFDTDFARLAAEASGRALTHAFKIPRPSKRDGARVLNEVQAFLERFVAYPNEWASTAHTLWIAHAHGVASFENTPRIAFLSPEPGSGKSRAMELTEALVPRPLLSVNASVSAIFRSIDDDAPPTLLMDEVDAIFTGKGDTAEELRGILNSGYRRGAVALRSAVRSKEVVVEEWPTFCATALAGLGVLPDTIMTRSVVVRMKRRRPNQRIEPFRRRVNGSEAGEIRVALGRFVDRAKLRDTWPDLPDGVADRDADVWEPLLAIADAAGGDWPNRARRACLDAVSESKARPASLGIQLLDDIRRVLGDRPRIHTAQLLGELHALPEAPWANLRGEQIDSRFLAKTLAKYDVDPAKPMRIGADMARGYERASFVDAWERYLKSSNEGDA